MRALAPRIRVAVLLIVAIMAVGCAAPDYLQAEWVLTEPPQGTALEVMVSAGNTCTKYDRVEVDETADRVQLRAFVRHTGDTGCADLLQLKQVTVELTQPLDDRRLLGCADEDIEVGGLRLDEDGDCREPQPSP